MENKNSHKKPLLSRKMLMAILWVIIFLGFPKGVFCAGLRDLIDEVSFVTLLVIGFIFICSILGVLARRANAAGSAGLGKGAAIFR